jgi:hypothetical protein
MGIEIESGGVTITPPRGVRGLTAAARYAFGTLGRAAVTVGMMLVAYVVVVLSSFPQYSLQMLSQLRVLAAIGALSWNLQATAGVLGLVLTLAYAVLAGLAATAGYGVVHAERHALGSTGGVLAGLLAASCGSCGAGILGLAGATGLVAAFPFAGNLLRLAAAVLLAAVLSGVGDPTVCDQD